MAKSYDKKILLQGFSVLFPVYNEGKIIRKNSQDFYVYLKNKGFENFEIMLCDNNSTDNTRQEALKASKKYPSIRYLFTEKKGIGSGIKFGIENSKFNLLVMISIDNAFDPKFVFDSIKTITYGGADLAIGSKRHNESKVVRPFSRRLASFAFNTFLNAVFWLNIGDTQGAVTFKKSSVLPFIKRLSSDDSFFQTQMMIYSKKNKLKIIEIPVNVVDTRKSSFNIKHEAFSLFRKVFREFLISRK